MTQRDEYISKMKAKLDEWNAEIDELEAKGKQLSAKSRKEYADRLATLKEKREEGRKKLDDLRNASGEAWDTLQSSAEIIWSEMKSTLKQTRDAFKSGMRS